MKNKFYHSLSFFFILFLTQKSSYAFFRMNSSEGRDPTRPIFKNETTGAIYLFGGAGFPMMTNLSSLNTLGINETAINSIIGTNAVTANYNTYFTLGIGYKYDRSILRHELEFSMMSLYSNPYDNFTKDSAELTNTAEDGTVSKITTQFLNFENRRLIAVGSATRQYRLMYNLYANFDQVFKLYSTSVDFFIMSGLGLAFIQNSLYVDSEYGFTADATTGVNTFNATVTNYDVNSYDTALSNKLKSTNLMLAMSFKFGGGLVFNLTQSFLAQVGLFYYITTKPFANLGSGSLKLGSNPDTIMMHNLTIEAGILFKGLDV